MIYNLVLNSSNVVGTNYTTFRYRFIEGSFNVSDDAEMCISQLIIPYSWYNINGSYYNNASFQYIWGDGTTYTFTLADGFYSTTQMNQALQLYMITNKQYLINTSTGNYEYFINIYSNVSYYANQFVLQPIPVSLPSGYSAPVGFVYSTGGYIPRIVITNNNFGAIIGFSAGTYPSSNQTAYYSKLSNIVPNATPVNSIIVTCDKVINACSSVSNILDTFYPNAAFGSNIVYTPTYEKWVSLVDGCYCYLNITIQDQNFRAIQARDPNVMISILIRQTNKKLSTKEAPITSIGSKLKALQYMDETEEQDNI